MIRIDNIFRKIEFDNIRKIDISIFIYLITRANSCEETKFIINKLESMEIVITPNMYELYLLLVEDYDEAIEVLGKIENYKITRKHKTKIRSIVYQGVMETAETLDQTEMIFAKMVKGNVKPSLGSCIILLERQRTYKDARNIMERYILSDEYYRERLEDKTNINDSIKRIYPILFSKAKSDKELKEIKGELNNLNLSVDISQQDIFNKNRRERQTYQSRKSLEETTNQSLIDNVKSFMKDSKKEFKKPERGICIPRRISRQTTSFDRNRTIVQELKELYRNSCQICNKTLDLGKELYSEVHHIHPLYKGGTDIKENMIVLCPNHHILFDRGAFEIDLKARRIISKSGIIEEVRNLKHTISDENINYHNKYIFDNETDLPLIDNGIVNSKSQYSKYNNKIVLLNNETKEEVIYQVTEKTELMDMSFIDYKLSKCKVDDLVSIDNVIYLVKRIC